VSDAPLLELTSHTDGKNAKVRIYPDRIEWERGKSVSGGKIAAGIMTGGLSLAATGVRSRKGAGTEMIPIHQVTSVTSKRDSMLNDAVSVVTAGNTVDFRVSRAEAQQLTALLLSLISGSHPAQRPAAPVIPAQAPAPTPAPTEDPIARLAGLHAQGILTDEEFAAAKAKALGL
jgi:hypothetical protein